MKNPNSKSSSPGTLKKKQIKKEKIMFTGVAIILSILIIGMKMVRFFMNPSENTSIVIKSTIACTLFVGMSILLDKTFNNTLNHLREYFNQQNTTENLTLPDNSLSVLIAGAGIAVLIFIIIFILSISEDKKNDTKETEEKADEFIEEITNKDYYGTIDKFTAITNKLNNKFLNESVKYIAILKEEKDENKQEKIEKFLEKYLPIITDIAENYDSAPKKCNEVFKVFSSSIKSFYDSLYDNTETLVNIETLNNLLKAEGWYTDYKFTISEREIN